MTADGPDVADADGEERTARGLAAILLVAGVGHFVLPEQFDAIVPEEFPAAWRRPITLASGVVELVTGGLLLVRRTRRLGGLLAFVTFLGVWPANIAAALRGGYASFPGWLASPTAAWVRVPLQLPLLWWSWRVARAPASPDRPDA